MRAGEGRESGRAEHHSAPSSRCPSNRVAPSSGSATRIRAANPSRVACRKNDCVREGRLPGPCVACVVTGHTVRWPHNSLVRWLGQARRPGGGARGAACLCPSRRYSRSFARWQRRCESSHPNFLAAGPACGQPATEAKGRIRFVRPRPNRRDLGQGTPRSG